MKQDQKQKRSNFHEVNRHKEEVSNLNKRFQRHLSHNEKQNKEKGKKQIIGVQGDAYLRRSGARRRA